MEDDQVALQKIFEHDTKMARLSKILSSITIFLVVVFLASLGVFTHIVMDMSSDMYKKYIHDTKEITISKDEIKSANSWERLPINERKEILRKRFYEIIKYYTIESQDNQKMGDEQILNAFNVYFNCITEINSVNFFLPLAYMKVTTNFNPNFSAEYKYGIAWLYIKQGLNIANLPLMKNSSTFRLSYKGKTTITNPEEAMRLLIAKMDDLMKTFNNREDWVILSLFLGEYEVIKNYWKNGEGKIPDSFYKKGEMKEILNYYYAFKNWKIIPN